MQGNAQRGDEMERETPYGDILIEIENGLWEHDCRVEEGIAGPCSCTDDHFRACLKIFMSGLMWKFWEHTEGKDIEDRAVEVEKLGNKLRVLVLEFTGIDTWELYRGKGD